MQQINLEINEVLSLRDIVIVNGGRFNGRFVGLGVDDPEEKGWRQYNLNRNQVLKIIEWLSDWWVEEPCDLPNVAEMFNEAEEYGKMADAIVEFARKYVICKAAFAQAYKEGHKVTGAICNELRSVMYKAESALDGAVSELDEWRLQHGWPESAETKIEQPQ